MSLRAQTIQTLADVVRAARRAALLGAQRSGVARAVSETPWRTRRLLILCYHGVSKRDEHGCSDLYVSPEHLRSRLQAIREERCTVVPLAEALERLATGTLPPRAVVLTFDDGAHDFLEMAAPTLAEFGYPATVYVTSFFTRYRWPVFEPMSAYLLWKGQGGTVTLPDGSSVVVPVDDEARAAVHRAFTRHASTSALDAESRLALANRIATELGIDFQDLVDARLFQLMSPDELRSLDRALVDLQLHTHLHTIPKEREALLESLALNRDVLVEAGRAADGPWHFCYPNGVRVPEMDATLREFGVQSATTCEPGYAKATHDRLQLPRLIDTMRMPEASFRAWLNGVSLR